MVTHRFKLLIIIAISLSDNRSAANIKLDRITKTAIGNEYFGAKYSISVHFNAAGSGSRFNAANGVEVYYHSTYGKYSKAFAQKVVNEIAKGTRQINRGAKRANLALCNTPHLGTQASILVECSFMTNKREVKSMMGKTSYWRETGTEIAKAVCAYSGVNYLEK